MRLSSFIGIALLAGLLLPAAPAAAQQTPADTTETPIDSLEAREEVAEEALDDLDQGAGDAEQLAERLADLADQPLDINTASAADLAQIPAISPFVAQNIVGFREQFGDYGSLPELRAVEGVTEDLFLEARPYLTIGETLAATGQEASRFPGAPSVGQIVSGLEFDLIQRYTRRLDLGEGYDDPSVRRVTNAGDTLFATRYLGSPGRLYTRLRARYERRVSLALVLDKDPGERFRWQPQNQTFGYDHVAGHVALNDFGRLKSLVVGDYTAEFGQGVLLWSSSSFGKGRNPVSPVVRDGRGIDPYSSTEENRFFRGVAGTVRLTPDLSLSTFASRRSLDATFVEPDTTLPRFGPDLDEGAAQASTLAESGLHRTASELAKKDALGETLVGGALEYATGAFTVGAAGYHARFDDPIVPDTSRLFRRFDFTGERATAASLYARAFVGDFLLFGEGARAPTGAYGGLGGVLAEFSDRAEAVVLARHFPRDFQSLHGYAFGERNGATQNETGVYAGLRLRPAEDWTVSGYFDQYRFPWVRFAVPRPSNGYDARLVAEHELRPWLSFYVQLRSETRETGATLNDTRGRPLDALREETRQSARLHLDYEFNDRLRLRSRIEGVRHFEEESDDEYGLILYQDVRWLPFEHLQLDARLAFFDTDSFDARVYAYENDLLYTFSVPAFFGQGQRAYLLLKYEPVDALDLELKYAATRFEGVDTIGSGLNEIDGSYRRELRAQVRWKF